MTIQIIITITLITFVIYYFLKENLENKTTQNQKRTLNEEVEQVLYFKSYLQNNYLFKTLPLPEPQKLISDVLFGNIERLTEKYFTLQDSKATKLALTPMSKHPDGKTQHGISIEFDNNGQIIENSLLNIDGSIELCSKFIYNNKLLVMTKIFDGKETTIIKYIYDNNKRIHKIEKHLESRPDKLIGFDKYQYDNIGNCVLSSGNYSTLTYFNETLLADTEIELSMEGYSLNSKSFYKITNENKLTLLNRVQYKYNQKSYETFYDEQLRMIKKVNYYNGSITNVFQYKYNKESIITNIKTFEQSFLTNETFYDDQGNLIKELIYKRQHKEFVDQITYEYTYDQYNNWIERKEQYSRYHNIILTRREIKYR